MNDNEPGAAPPDGTGAVTAPEQPDQDRLSEAEVKAAIEQSGYPLEVQLFHELAEQSLNPTLGFQLQLPNGKVKELDLLSTSHSLVRFSGPAVEFSLKGVIGVKRIVPPDWFVGILPSAQPEPVDKLNSRIQCIGGLPNNGLDEYSKQHDFSSLLLGEQHFANAMHLLTKPPICVHWAVTRRDGKKLKADGPQPIWDDIETTVAASYQLATELTREWRQHSDKRSEALPHLYFMLPTLALDVPHLFLYNPMTRELSRTGWLTLRKAIHIGDGRIVSATIDVTSRDGFKELAMVHNVTRSRMQVTLQVLAARLAAMAQKQYDEGIALRAP
jgi:hypothetical protein